MPVHGARPVGAEAALVHPAGPAPQPVEHGLHARGDAELGEHRDVPVGEHLGVLESVRPATHRCDAESLRGFAEAVDNGVAGGVADDMEAGLEARVGGGDDMLGHLRSLEVPGAQRVGRIRVGLAQAGGPGSDGAVGEQVAGHPDGAQLLGACDPAVGGQLAPVARDEGPGGLIDGPQEVGEVVLAADGGPGHLVHADHSVGGRVLPHDRLCLPSGVRADAAEDGLPNGVMGLLAQRSGGIEARELAHPGGTCDERARDGRGMDVHPGEVDHTPPRRPVDLLTTRRATLGPPRLVPPVPDDGPPAQGSRPGLQEGEGLRQGGRRAEIEPGQRQAGTGGVHVGVDEARGHEGALRGRRPDPRSPGAAAPRNPRPARR